MTDEPALTIRRQTTFGKDGSLEVSDEAIETSLEDFGADVDHRERDSRLDQPEASEFGVDDRPTVTVDDDGEQWTLFADTDEDQQTLAGEEAVSQCLFSD